MNKRRGRGDVCSWESGPSLTGPLRKLLNNPRTLLERYVSEGMTVADIGAGMGFFTLPIAELVGAGGTVIAIDLQPEMLAGLEKNAEAAGVTNIITHHCAQNTLDIEQWNGSVDLALAYWMLHEVPDPERLIREVSAALTDTGVFIFVEPIIHVSQAKFQESLKTITELGFRVIDRPKVSISRAAILQKAG